MSTKIEHCGVILPNITICQTEAVVTVTSPDGSFILPFCEEHANRLYINREEMFVQELTENKEKRIYGIQLPAILDEPAPGADISPDVDLPDELATTTLENNQEDTETSVI